jgi:serine/threonine protein phosphatase PrpC
MDSRTELKIDVAALTDMGCVRTNNEDGFGYDLASRAFVVCDGMGGMAAGEVASATAVKEMVENFSRDAGGQETTEDRLYRAIVSANHQVYQLALGNEELHGMGTTLVAACIDGRKLLIGNVGDSRAYFLRGGVCAQITNDHSFLAEQVRRGAMSIEEAKASPLQSVITRAIGSAETVEPDIFTGDLEAGDIVLLTSDGLTRYADAKAIAMLIFSCTNLTDACQALIDRAKSQGAVDNVTCLLLQFLPAEEMKAEEAPAEEAPAMAMPAPEALAPEAVATEAVFAQAGVTEVWSAETPAAEMPLEAKRAEETAAEGTPAEEEPGELSLAEEKQVAEKPLPEKPVEEKPAEEMPELEAPAVVALSALEKAFAEMLAEDGTQKAGAQKASSEERALEGEAE